MHPLDQELINASADGDLARLGSILARVEALREARASGPFGFVGRWARALSGPKGALARDPDYASGGTALTEAAKRGHLDAVRLLLPLSDPDATDGMGNTPLMLACQRGFDAIAGILIPACDPNLRNDFGDRFKNPKTALLYAAEGGHAGCVALLCKIKTLDYDARDIHTGADALMTAAAKGDALCAEPILDAFPQAARSADNSGRTALIDWVGGRGAFAPLDPDRERFLRKLVDASDVGARDRKRSTALSIAQSSQNQELATLIASSSRPGLA